MSFFVGAIGGSTLATSAHLIGISQLFLIGSMQVFAVSLMIKVYNIVFRDKATESARTRVRSISEDENEDSTSVDSSYVSNSVLVPAANLADRDLMRAPISEFSSNNINFNEVKIEHFARSAGDAGYQLNQMPGIILRNTLGLLKIKFSKF